MGDMGAGKGMYKSRRVQAPFDAVGIGTGNGAVLSRIPEGACACGAEGPMASIGPLALGAKGSVRYRLTPPGRFEGSALGRYIASLRWGGTAPSAPSYICLYRLRQGGTIKLRDAIF